MSKERVIEIALGELGYTENPPGSNQTKYGQIYGYDGVPWCVIFLYAIFKAAGEGKAFFGGAKTASCGTLYRWYKEQGLTVPVPEVQAGDIVLLNFHGGSSPEHCGLAVEVGMKNGIYTVTTIEGNTSPGFEGSQDNGGCVAEKARHIRQIVGVCRPQYKEEPVKKTDYDGHWAQQDIEWTMHLGFVKGYPDGSFRPDQDVTRAETAVILRRVTDYLLGEVAEANAKIIVLEAEITALKAELDKLKEARA